MNRQGRSELRSSGRSVSPSPIRYHSPGGLATHLSQKVTNKSSKEAVGLKLSNLTPPGSRKYGTYAMGGNYERSDSSLHPTPSSSNYHKTSVNSAVKNTPPSARKGLGVNPLRPNCTSGKNQSLQSLSSVTQTDKSIEKLKANNITFLVANL